MNHVAKWNGTSWESLGVGNNIGIDNVVNSVTVSGSGQVYAGGYIAQAGGLAVNNVAQWSGGAWRTLGTALNENGLDSYVSALAVASNGDLYVCGNFSTAGGVAARSVAKWNGTSWSNLGSTFGPYNFRDVLALAVANNGDVYAGGYFTQIGGVYANNLAKWNGTSWSALGAGISSTIRALAVTPNGDVYVGGVFSATTDGTPANNVAKWNGTAWSGLGAGAANGVNNGVAALVATSNGDLYVSGGFTQAGSIAANYVAKWNGTAWSSLGTGAANGTNSGISKLAVASNGDLYVGGNFTQAGGTAVRYLARWNGTAWNAVGPAFTLSGTITALAVASNGDVYVGGYIQVTGLAASYIAVWNGTAWNALGSGLNDAVYCLAVGPTGKLNVGGEFATTGDGSKVMAHFGIYDPAAPLATAAAKATPAGQLFPNPAHSTATLRLPAATARQPLTLTDALGRLVRQYPAPAGPEAVLDLRGLPAGTYLVRCGALSQRLVVE